MLVPTPKICAFKNTLGNTNTELMWEGTCFEGLAYMGKAAHMDLWLHIGLFLLIRKYAHHARQSHLKMCLYQNAGVQCSSLSLHFSVGASMPERCHITLRVGSGCNFSAVINL